MNNEKRRELRDYLLELLWHDKEIQDKIVDLVRSDMGQAGGISREELNNLQNEFEWAQDEKQELNNKINELNAELEKAQQKNEEYVEIIQNLEDDIQGFLTELEEFKNINKKFCKDRDKWKELSEKAVDKAETLREEKDKLKKDLTYYKENFSSLVDNYRLFNQLNDNISASFGSIVNNSSPMAFLLSGADYETIRLYFEKVSMEWKKYNNSTLTALNSIFDFFFEQFRLNNPEFRRIGAEEGQDFSLDMHTRTSDSKPVGKIRRVIIDGYENGNKKIKSLVEIG